MHGGEFAIRRQREIRRATVTGMLGIAAAVLAMLLVLAIAAVALAAKPASAAAIGDGDTRTAIGTGNETPLSEILAVTGHSLVRISDSLDLVWEIADGPDSAMVRARARHAGYNNTFGVKALDGAGAAAFEPLFAPRGPSHRESADEPWFDLGRLFDLGQQFVLALKTPVHTFTSVASLNADGLDHMVTWVDAADPTHDVVGFEDLLTGGDRDFNDLVVELRSVLDGPLPTAVPEPSPLIPLAAGMALLLFALRRRREDA